MLQAADVNGRRVASLIIGARVSRERYSVPIERGCDSGRFRRQEYWIGEIDRLLRSAGKRTIELARLMYEARRRLAEGEWTRLWKGRRIGFSKRKGDMLVTVGRELGKLDEQNIAQLPVHWSVLYQLALLGTATVARLIAEGVIHPGLSLREAQELRSRKACQRGLTIERMIRRLEERVRQSGSEFSEVRRVACAEALHRLAAAVLIHGT